TAADIRLDDGDVEARLAALQVERRPHAGHAAADNADIGAMVAGQRRRVLLAREDRFAQPGSSAGNAGLHRVQPSMPRDAPRARIISVSGAAARRFKSNSTVTCSLVEWSSPLS